MSSDILTKVRKTLFANRFLTAGIVLVLIDLAIGIVGRVWTPYPPGADFGISQPPSLAHLLGTDEFGHDVLSEMMYDTLPTLIVGFGVGLSIALISTVIGLVSGYYGRKVSGVVIDVLTTTALTIPGVVLLVVIGAYFRTASESLGYLVIVFALAITGWAFGAKQIRSQVLGLANREYVLASKMLGEKWYRILFTQLLPPILPLTVAQFLFGTLYGILSLVTAEYWGVLAATTNNLGTMIAFIAANAAYLSNQWWWILGAILPIIILGGGLGCLNLGLDEFIDPRLKVVEPEVPLKDIELPIDQGTVVVKAEQRKVKTR
ncbi:hypothetical protein HS1genome_1649 [Sulfodiicoccus acidiphilus]|uniref:ABC transmembrane type-1 domain-containing protein n=1 Tax=Sulfodiicoccus acidiphilus TaxID=1670455 RepID=A0A348B508_9CREN|nr:ABC transporter permease [Sulfodiicoccus acidiphilus]BBD73260.1 hypothetical protein HS1genome_1649 [Sulfodiicoccus acidiphilus]GGT89537.1 hypothetical protein GCM10007116_04230 [Sulfodiicoccus acidiphilus]